MQHPVKANCSLAFELRIEVGVRAVVVAIIIRTRRRARIRHLGGRPAQETMRRKGGDAAAAILLGNCWCSELSVGASGPDG